MIKLVAKCPSCQTPYSVSQEQLRIADGKVRCGRCLTVFHVIHKTPKPVIDPLILLQQLAPDPPELNFTTSQPPSSQTLAIAGSCLALLLLASQYLWFERATLAQKPRVYPLYAMLCQQLDCTLSSHQSLAWLQTSQLQVSSQTEQPDRLEVFTELTNTGPLPVPLPIMRLQFSDASGRILAASDFQPNTYFPGSHSTQLLPGQTQAFRLLIQRPATGHLGYQLDWLATPAH